MKKTHPPHPTQPARRSFLKAAGISIALPSLDSIAKPTTPTTTPPTTAQQQTNAPMRMVCISSALGVNPEAFFPASFENNDALSPTLQPMTSLRNDFTVFSHMDHPGIHTKHGSMNSLLSGVDAKVATAGQNVSMDQIAAEHVAYQTRFPSIHICLGGKLDCSWSASGIKIREESDPLDLFRKLFVNDPQAANHARKLQLEQQGSVLDLVRHQARRLEQNANAIDRAKLDEYLTAIREAETKIQGMQQWLDIPKPQVDFDTSGHAHSTMDYPFLSPLMFDLLFLAIQSDSSRVFTAGFGMHNNVIELDGVVDGYHGLTHHGNLPERLKQLRIIDKFYMQQMARFTQKLKNTTLDNGTLLDRTMVFFGSGLGNASRHSNRDLPLLLAGGGFKHGTHINCMQPNQEQKPLNNLFTTMLQNFGVEIDQFSNATGNLNELLA